MDNIFNPHNEELNDLYFSPNIVRGIKVKNEVGGACCTNGKRCNRVLVWKPEGKRPLGRPRRRWEDNIKMYLQEVGYRLDQAGSR